MSDLRAIRTLLEAALSLCPDDALDPQSALEAALEAVEGELAKRQREQREALPAGDC